jgi:hypothetical protein
MEISARRALPVRSDAAFAFLSLPDNHRRLATTERVLLAIGGRAWVQRLFVATLERLAADLSEEPGRICAPRRREGQAWRLPTLIGANPRWR